MAIQRKGPTPISAIRVYFPFLPSPTQIYIFYFILGRAPQIFPPLIHSPLISNPSHLYQAIEQLPCLVFRVYKYRVNISRASSYTSPWGNQRARPRSHLLYKHRGGLPTSQVKYWRQKLNIDRLKISVFHLLSSRKRLLWFQYRFACL